MVREEEWEEGRGRGWVWERPNERVEDGISTGFGKVGGAWLGRKGCCGGK